MKNNKIKSIPHKTIPGHIPKKSWKQISEGGESIIYKNRQGDAIKIFRHWEDDYYFGEEDQQEAAKNRFIELQNKLPKLPKMPKEVVSPKAILQTKNGSIFGYEMDYLDNEEIISFDLLWNKITMKKRLNALEALRKLVSQLHRREIVIGDFVPRDILYDVDSEKIYMVDSDSMQYSKFNCKTFTIGYADPNVLRFECKRGELPNPILDKPYSFDTDWFSFFAICCLVLLGVDPYGGTHPRFHSKEERVMKNITLFHKNVIYPKTATSLKKIDRNLLETILKIFLYNDRIKPTKKLLSGGEK